MLPPRPPSPPSGPPRGTNFSRRNEALPSPPWPAITSIFASSKNFIEIKKPRAGRGSFVDEEPLRLRRLDRHGGLAVRPVLRVLHVAGDRGEQGVVLAHAHVVARVETRAALANEDGSGVHQLAAIGLEAQAL